MPRFKMNVTAPDGKELYPLTEFTSREELEAAARAYRLSNGQVWMGVETGDSQLISYITRDKQHLMNIHVLEG